ncbi:MAG TPA: DEAD/DEAH box helicase [Prolixibacteraceae bacterium]|nr:DEAD/DEAH box helicase [Prolixibacteraceae bacterium]
MTFDELALIEPIRRAIKEEGYTTPTPIQQQSIPILLEGNDLMGCAQTGTGKTAAFSIPILQLLEQNSTLSKGRRNIKALIVTPTRELAIQINESLESYGKYTSLKHTVIFGGVSQLPQTNALRQGVDILVATPGRLLDLMNQGFIKLSSIEYFVLDEADRMLDMGFLNDVKRIIKELPNKRQSLFFSATMPMNIVHLASTILNNPQRVTITPETTTAETVQQKLYYVSKENKRSLLVDLLNDSSIVSALIFTRTKYGADKLTQMLVKKGIKSEALHSNKSQQQRQRALNNFKTQQTRVLVATDIAARGIDIDDLSCVINFEIPNISETYVHRIGRTGRAGASGRAISLCDNDELPYIRDIQRLISMRIDVVKDHPYVLEINNQPTPKEASKKQKQNPDRRKQGNNFNNARNSRSKSTTTSSSKRSSRR